MACIGGLLYSLAMAPRESLLGRLLLGLCLTALSACDAELTSKGQRATPTLSKASEREAGQAEPEKTLALQVALELERTRRYLDQPIERPRTFAEQACPEPRLHALPKSKLTLHLGASDARREQKDLLPLPMLELLRSDPLATLEVRALPSTFEQALALARSAAQAEQTLAALAELRARRFKAQLHIVDYKEPRRFFHVRENRWRWGPGSVLAWLAIHDLEDGEPLCQTLVRAANDVSSASTAVRDREAVRRRLERELALLTLHRSRDALGRMSRVLSLPPADAPHFEEPPSRTVVTSL